MSSSRSTGRMAFALALASVTSFLAMVWAAVWVDYSPPLFRALAVTWGLQVVATAVAWATADD